MHKIVTSSATPLHDTSSTFPCNIHWKKALICSTSYLHQEHMQLWMSCRICCDLEKRFEDVAQHFLKVFHNSTLFANLRNKEHNNLVRKHISSKTPNPVGLHEACVSITWYSRGICISQTTLSLASLFVQIQQDRVSHSTSLRPYMDILYSACWYFEASRSSNTSFVNSARYLPWMRLSYKSMLQITPVTRLRGAHIHRRYLCCINFINYIVSGNKYEINSIGQIWYLVLPYLLDENLPQTALPTWVIFQIEFIKPLKYRLICMHIKCVHIEIIP